MVELTQKQLDKLINKNKKSKFQNCYQCKYFPKDLNNTLGKVSKSTSEWFWNVQNVEVITFRCKYLRKRVSEAIKPFRTNSCICFKKNGE